MSLSIDRLHELLDYDPQTGIFLWRYRPSDKWFNARFAGKEAGTLMAAGYRMINIDHKQYLAHRLAWFHHHGEWPKHQIAHRDLNPSHNAIANLVDRTPSEINADKRMRIGKSGHKGVHRQGSKWIATTDYKGKRIHFGTFATVEEAAAAYEAGMQDIETWYEQRQDYADRKRPIKTREPLSHAELLRHLFYDPINGKFYRRRGDTVAEEAGHVGTHGYRRVRVGGRRYPAHVLAVFYVTGSWPTGLVDHDNGVKDDNRWSNLRVATHSQNSLNEVQPNPTRGIRKTRNKMQRWEARITIEGKLHQIGTFDTEQDATAAWIAFVAERGLEDYARRSVNT